MIAAKNSDEFEVQVAPYIRIPQLGDMIEINYADNPDCSGKKYGEDWGKFCGPLKDEQQVAWALETIKTKGMNFYSRPSFAREYRAMPQIGGYGRFQEISLEDLQV